MRPKTLIGTLGFAFLAACGDSDNTEDTSEEATETAQDTQVPDGAADVTTGIEDAVEPDTLADVTDVTVDSASDTTPDAGPDPWDVASAFVSVTITGYANNAPRTLVAGALWAAPEPETYALADASGSCRLSFGENFFCDPPCEAGVCTAPDPADVCTPYPALLSAGNLVASGGSDSVRMKAGSDGGGGYASESDGAVWQTGEEITFSADGADVPAFSTALRMIEPMVGKDLAALDLSKPLVIEWQPPTSSGNPTRVSILLQSDRGQHGRAYASLLECDVPDTGRFEIPAALQAKYVADEVWGCGKCPPSKLTRYVRTRVTAGGHEIDVSVRAQEMFLLTPWSTPSP